MKKFLERLLVCPVCINPFEVEDFYSDNGDIIEGALLCYECKAAYPVINTIPRIFPGSLKKFPDFYARYKKRFPDFINTVSSENIESEVEKLKAKTCRSFGYQWAHFSQMSCDFRENFLNYIYPPVSANFFPGKTGLDVGCGFGRHIYNAAAMGADMVGIDISDAIESAYNNTKNLDNIYLVQCDAYNLPFRKCTFDFVYSLGVLHHLPSPEDAYQRLVAFVKEDGAVFIWVYSKDRKIVNFFLESIRSITHRLPLGFLKRISFIAAVIDWGLFIWPYKISKKTPFVDNVMKRITLPRIKVYSNYPFQVVYADWFDRLSPPIRYYYDNKDLELWASHANLKNVQISPTGHYGWRVYGEKRSIL